MDWRRIVRGADGMGGVDDDETFNYDGRFPARLKGRRIKHDRRGSILAHRCARGFGRTHESRPRVSLTHPTTATSTPTGGVLNFTAVICGGCFQFLDIFPRGGGESREARERAVRGGQQERPGTDQCVVPM